MFFLTIKHGNISCRLMEQWAKDFLKITSIICTENFRLVFFSLWTHTHTKEKNIIAIGLLRLAMGNLKQVEEKMTNKRTNKQKTFYWSIERSRLEVEAFLLGLTSFGVLLWLFTVYDLACNTHIFCARQTKFSLHLKLPVCCFRIGPGSRIHPSHYRKFMRYRKFIIGNWSTVMREF